VGGYLNNYWKILQNIEMAQSTQQQGTHIYDVAIIGTGIVGK